jgi:serine/threonine protein phosphatase PrpC
METLIHKSIFHDQGVRPHDEDRVKVLLPFANQNNLLLIVVVDGHGGSKCADFVIDRFPEALEKTILNCKSDGVTQYTTFMHQALNTCVEEWDFKCFGNEGAKIQTKETRKQFFAKRDVTKWKQDELESGCTLCTALVDLTKREIHILNIGDSRAAWCCDEKLIGETVDHSVKNQMDPIKNFDFEYGDGYLEDDLSMCRSIGDNTEKLFRIVSRKPDLLTIPMGMHGTRLVVATDGFFDWVSPQDALYEEYKDADELANQISKFDDNITVVYVKFGPGLYQEPSTIEIPPCSVRRSKSPKKEPVKIRKTSPIKKGRSSKEPEIIIHTSREPKPSKIKKSIKRNPIQKMTQEQINSILGEPRYKEEKAISGKKLEKKSDKSDKKHNEKNSDKKSNDKKHKEKANDKKQKANEKTEKKSSGQKKMGTRRKKDTSFDALLASLG